MCTSSVTQDAAASFEDGASARFATSANSTRSVAAASRRDLPSSFVIAVPIPSRSHSPSSTQAPPTGRDSTNESPSASATPCTGSVGEPSTRCSEPISRSIPARSTCSARPKLYSTRIFEVWVAGSHSLCASCR